MRDFLPVDQPAPPRPSRQAWRARRVPALLPIVVLCLLAISACEEPAPQQRIENAHAYLQRGDLPLAIIRSLLQHLLQLGDGER